MYCGADVLKVFAEKKSVKLAKLLERGGFSMEKTKPSGGPTLNPNPNQERAPSIQVTIFVVLVS